MQALTLIRKGVVEVENGQKKVKKNRLDVEANIVSYSASWFMQHGSRVTLGPQPWRVAPLRSRLPTLWSTAGANGPDGENMEVGDL
jgi:hypothetical protein